MKKTIPFNYFAALLWAFIFCTEGHTQNATAETPIPRDTSFTIYQTFIKESKKRPYIKIAEPLLSDAVLSRENIVYCNTGKRDLLLDVYYPAGKKKKGFPGVLLIFGGGWRSGDKSQNKAMATALAAKGFVAVTAEYRLSLEAQYPAAVHDLKTAVRWMRAHAKEFKLNSEKIASLGCSAGGQLAALLGTTNGNPAFEGKGEYQNFTSNVQAIIDIDGTLAFHHPESAEGTVAAQWLGGNYAEKPEIWEEAAPLSHTDKNTAPTLFINSSIPRFHAGRDDMIRKMNQLNIYSEVHEMPDTPHPFWFFHPWFDPMMGYIEGFLNKVFK